MARRDDLLELLRPPAHRGPLIAAGAVVFTLGIAMEELRLADELPNGVHVVILALAAALDYGLGVQARLEDGMPAAFQSVLLVCGLLLLAGMLLELANLLGASLLETRPASSCGRRCCCAVRRRSPRCGATRRSAAWSPPSPRARRSSRRRTGSLARLIGVYRWLLLALAVGYVLGSLVLRGDRPRHAELMVVTAGLATSAIVLLAVQLALFGGFLSLGGGSATILPGFWELAVLAAGCGLIAYGAVDRVPGAAWLGLAHLVGFLVVASAGADNTLLWWPLLLLGLGGGVLVAGLRPRSPLPPEPDGYAVDRPLASRADDDEMVVRVRDDKPPSG